MALSRYDSTAAAVMRPATVMPMAISNATCDKNVKVGNDTWKCYHFVQCSPIILAANVMFAYMRNAFRAWELAMPPAKASLEPTSVWVRM